MQSDRVWAVQFHPEVAHTESGTELLRAFLFDFCKAKSNWSPRKIADHLLEDIRVKVAPNETVLCALSGGVDSTVVAMLLTKAILPGMLQRGRGHIVNIASLAGLVPFPTNAPYAASKHAVVGLSLSLRTEGEDLGVKVSAVCPGFIQTGIFAATPFINADAEKIMKEIPFPPIPATEAAARILDGVRRNQAVISFPGYARFLWRLYRLAVKENALFTRWFTLPKAAAACVTTSAQKLCAP